MSYLSDAYLWVMCIVLCSYAIWADSASFLYVVRRMKWLFLSIFVIYAFGTQGEYIQYIPTSIAPTKEGCILGILQIAKLLIALATLGILFSTSSKEQLMSGLHLLLSPLNILGINTNKFIARLLLTLDYVEELAAKEKFKFNFDQLDNMLATTELFEKDKVIVLEDYPFNWTDKVVLIILILSTIAIFYFRIFNFKVLL
jgi:energy-coupling factor transport system permease protein